MAHGSTCPGPGDRSFLCEPDSSVTWNLSPVGLPLPEAGLPDGRVRLFGNRTV